MEEIIELLEENWDPDYGYGQPFTRRVIVCNICSALILNSEQHRKAVHG